MSDLATDEYVHEDDVSQRVRVFNCIKRWPDLTAGQIAAIEGLKYETVDRLCCRLYHERGEIEPLVNRVECPIQLTYTRQWRVKGFRRG